MPDRALLDELRSIGEQAGLHRVGFASAEPFTEARVALDERRGEGLHGGMQFTYRNPARATEPARSLASVQSLVVGARAYPAAPSPPDDRARGFGPLARVARYATGDHYGELRRGLEAIAARLAVDGHATRVLLDDNALVDRAAAHRAGIGWFGKNANILIDGVGSWFVLGSVLTDAPLAAIEGARAEPRAMAEGCGACTRCLTACPTGAIVEPGVVDARRCLAWLVQAEGVFPVEHRVALGDRIYGCDVCQEVCPPSARTERAERTEPAEDAAGAGTWVPLLDLLRATDDELLERHGRWYIPRRDPRYLRRNALIALGNAASVPVAPDVRDVVASYCRRDDPMLRAHALWAARRLRLDDLVASLADDPDPLVHAELAIAVPPRAGSPASDPDASRPGGRAR